MVGQRYQVIGETKIGSDRDNYDLPSLSLSIEEDNSDGSSIVN